jgi:PHP family Zn ribbon phosphoesterase
MIIDLAQILEVSSAKSLDVIALADYVRDKVKRLLKKYEEIKVNNEEFQNLVVKELDSLNRSLMLKR